MLNPLGLSGEPLYGLTRQTWESHLNAFALSELVGRKWGGMLGKSSKESFFVPSGRDILGG